MAKMAVKGQLVGVKAINRKRRHGGGNKGARPGWRNEENNESEMAMKAKSNNINGDENGVAWRKYRALSRCIWLPSGCFLHVCA